MASDYAPMIRNLFRATLDHDKAPTPAHRDAQRVEADQIIDTLVAAKKQIQADLDKGYAYFQKHGGWGATEPSPLPKGWNDKTSRFLKLLRDYEIVVSAKKVAEEMLWFGR